MAGNKLRMSNKRFMAILIPVLVLLFAIILVVTCVMNFFSMTMDTYLGRGERKVDTVKGSENWDTEYYKQKYQRWDGENGSQLATAKVVEEVTDEGIILLKNSDKTLPIAKKTKVSPFGFRYLSPIYGGTGSGNVNVSADYVATAQKAFNEYFEINTTLVNAMNSSKPYGMSATGYTEYEDVSGYDGSSKMIGEFNPAIYDTQAIKASCKDTVGVVFIGRIGGEGGDLQTTPYIDGTKHALRLSEYEKNTIKFAKANCSKVVIIMNSSNAFEMAPLMQGELSGDAILWIGGPGSVGFKSAVKIMCGEVNPSGRTVDIFPSDFMADPVLKNYGDFRYDDNLTTINRSNGKPSTVQHNFLDYEEGVYVGYKYYETAYDLDRNAYNYGELNVDGSLKKAGAVCYPFGYGLSYTTFSQKIVSYSDSGDEIDMTVRVMNTGNEKGKDAVQVYYGAPYTELDKEMKIEKPAVNLIEFAKTGIIEPGKFEDVDISFAKEDMSSYCYTRKNPDNTVGCYVLEAGDYNISVRRDSHTALDQKTTKINTTIWYDGSDSDHIRQSEKDAQSVWDEKGDPTNVPEKALLDSDETFVAATNQFENCNDYMLSQNVTSLSRSDWAGTQPTVPVADKEDGTFSTPEKVLAELKTYGDILGFDYNTDPLLGNVEGSKVYNDSPVTENAKNGLVLSDMRGKSYYDPLWEDLLDQLDLSPDPNGQLYTMLFFTSYTTTELDAIGKPKTRDLDGPQGITTTSFSGGMSGECTALCAEPVVAATFNKALAKKLGDAVGQEALVNDINGWYAPGVNMHRSPFSGRNFEYYSEDSVLTGWICASVVEGCADNGFYTFIKHCIMNDQETRRHYICTWATEQTIREIYLKPLEITMKNAKTTIKYTKDSDGNIGYKTIKASTAMMVAHNLIGGTHAGMHYGFQTAVLRDEWGWHGTIETDMYDPINRDAMLRAGCDILMTIYKVDSLVAHDTSNTAKHVLRKAVHNIAYTVANSSIMNNAAPGSIVYYTMSPWAIWLLVANVIIYAVIIAGVVWIVLRLRHSKKHPDLYKRKQTV